MEGRGDEMTLVEGRAEEEFGEKMERNVVDAEMKGSKDDVKWDAGEKNGKRRRCTGEKMGRKIMDAGMNGK